MYTKVIHLWSIIQICHTNMKYPGKMVAWGYVSEFLSISPLLLLLCRNKIGWEAEKATHAPELSRGDSGRVSPGTQAEAADFFWRSRLKSLGFVATKEGSSSRDLGEGLYLPYWSPGTLEELSEFVTPWT